MSHCIFYCHHPTNTHTYKFVGFPIKVILLKLQQNETLMLSLRYCKDDDDIG